MKKYITKTVLGLTTSVMIIIFILAPMMTNAKDYGPLLKTKTLSYTEVSFNVGIQATYHGDGTNRWSSVAFAPQRLSGNSQGAITKAGDIIATRVPGTGYKATRTASVAYNNMGMTFNTNSATYTWTFVESTSTLK